MNAGEFAQTTSAFRENSLVLNMRLGLLIGCFGLMVHALFAQQADSLLNMASDSNATIAAQFTNMRLMQEPVVHAPDDAYTIPFTMAGRLILIEARIDTLHGNFILDTGAPHLVLNKSWFRKYGRTAYVTAGGITGGISEVMTAVIDDLLMQGIQYKYIEADVIELSHIESSRGVAILGLLGLNLFSNFELMIDYDQQLIRLYKLDRKGNRLQPTPEHLQLAYELPLQIANNTLLIDGKLNGVNMRYCIDTGAELNVLHNRLPKKAMEDVKITSRTMLSGTSASKIEVLRGTASGMQFGKYHCMPQPVLITHLGHMSRAFDLRIDGMLGYDFLSISPVSINFNRKTLSIWVNKEGNQ
ncbi:MAG: retroviral-like aspartic protease family protein [Bacteroidia bacterium]